MKKMSQAEIAFHARRAAFLAIATRYQERREAERQDRIHDARMSRGETDPNGELGYTPGLRR